MIKLTETQKAYIAGLIDGEGCISITCAKPKRGWNANRLMFQLRVTVCNTDYRIVKWLKDNISFGYINERKRQKVQWADIYVYMLTATKAYELLMLVYDYLVIKKEQAKIGMNFQRTMLRQKNNVFGCKGLSEQILEVRYIFKNKMHELNKRGISSKGSEFEETLTDNADGNLEPSRDLFPGVCRDYELPSKEII